MSTGNDDLEAWKRQRTIELAFELADSGQFENFTDIAYALQFERGMVTAQLLIDDPDMRRRLNERCSSAREALVPAVEPAVIRQEAARPDSTPMHAPSWLRRAAAILSRTSNTGELNSAPL